METFIIAGLCSFVVLLICLAAVWFAYSSVTKRIETLALETRQALGEIKLSVAGAQDTVNKVNVDQSVLESEVAEALAKMGGDQIEKLVDRVGQLELTLGLTNRFRRVTPKSE